MPTLRAYRRAFARQTGTFRAGVATGESTRSELVDSGLRSSLARLSEYEHAYLLRPDAVAVSDRVRLIEATDSLRGVLKPDFPAGVEWTNAPYLPGAGEAYEILSNWFHPTEDVPHFVAQALRQIHLWDELRVPAITAGGLQAVGHYYPELTDPSAVREVRTLAATGQRGDTMQNQAGTLTAARTSIAPAPLRGTAELQGGRLYLRLAGGGLTAGTAATTVRATLSSSSLVYVTANSLLPTTYPFWIVIESELIQITGLSGAQPAAPAANYAAARGEGGSLAVAHATGAGISLAPVLSLRGRFPAASLCRAAGGRFGDQTGLTFETDEALPDEGWVTAGALVQAWTEQPDVMEQAAEQRKLGTIAQALGAFRRWQEVTDAQGTIPRTFQVGPWSGV